MKMRRHDLPQLLVINPPGLFDYGDPFAAKFTVLRAWESPLPLPRFLSAHAQSAPALLCSAATRVTAGLLDLLPSLRIIVTTSAGLNHIDVPECRRRGIAVANAGEVFSDDVADAAVGLALDVLRRVSAADRFVRRGLWAKDGDFALGSKQLVGKRVGIVGLGSIGLQVAKRLEAFGCPVSYNSRTKKPSVSYTFYANVYELAANSDILIICCALTEQTRHMIGKSVLLALGKDGIIINVGRGAIIDEKELVQSLVWGEIRGSGLDVFENEPNVPEELLSLDNVVLSPHVAAFTEESFQDLTELMIANLEAFFSNKPLITPVMDKQ
ncbi:glyoxylate/hydroxypyruvate reductase HPR3 isoform X1 [Rhodamnia argentea]|uniref:Glyoxylate/hydroxypyruvate reductase HPR3 isoform X1 n=1 Tax=Rhodamnia argentea TaxID=178133 RepID=A0ABM3HWM2_9MYRT|nr:glyoxylate/hydroxypyruvate reductase HPR3 isoform X1 [Rhodamnia argentea]